MARMIDLDEVKNKLSEELKNIELPLLKRTLFKLLLEFFNDETVFRTVDTVEVVRCKDCKHSTVEPKWNGKEYCACNWNVGDVREVDESHYCSYGERREENEAD